MELPLVSLPNFWPRLATQCKCSPRLFPAMPTAKSCKSFNMYSANLPAHKDLRRLNLKAAGLLLLAFLSMYGPTYFNLATTIWATDEQGHGPIILVVSLWLIYRSRESLLSSEHAPAPLAGWAWFAVALALFVLGRTQDVLALEVLSKIILMAASVLLVAGWSGLRQIWFALFFLLFMVPLPETVVSAVTAPLKSAVSVVASSLLYQMGLPVARSGVVLTVGKYQLMVADACSGLNSMFTLEALGMLYMNLMQYTSTARNVTLALLLIPISFAANVIRVLILVLVTYFLGDQAGQGFLHGFAGMVLFMVALAIMLVIDKILGVSLFKAGKA